MKKWIGLAFWFLALATFAQDMTAEEKAQQEAWMKASTPGAEHARLAETVGKWKTTTTSFPGPGAPPVKSEGTAELTAILGGRFIQSAYKGEMWGLPFEGFGVTGYDNVKKQLQTSWVDNMGTSVSLMTGSYDPATKTETFTGTMTSPVGGEDIKMKNKIVYTSKDSFTFYMSMVVDGKDVPMLEMVHTRQ